MRYFAQSKFEDGKYLVHLYRVGKHRINFVGHTWVQDYSDIQDAVKYLLVLATYPQKSLKWDDEKISSKFAEIDYRVLTGKINIQIL